MFGFCKSGQKLVLDGPATITSRDQLKTEGDVIACFRALLSTGGPEQATLERDLHKAWLMRSLKQLPTNFAGLDASRPWFVFWISHALEILESYDEAIWPPQVAAFIAHCQHPDGGFAGGPGQLAHLAPTYAAVAALIIAGCEESYRAADRKRLYEFLMRMKAPTGGFRMHDEGETDMRGTYCAMAVASMLHMLTDELVEGVPQYVRRCQTYEGGIAGESGLEAHGGYSYCGLAALCIIGEAPALDLNAFLNWAVHRQMALEGGFQGRTNKLVDSCYSFWMGAIFPLLREAFLQKGEEARLPPEHLWYAPTPLQTYVFLACQHRSGGLRDKPGKAADFYHTCYALSGVAGSMYGIDPQPQVLGDQGNLLRRIDVFYNVLLEKAERKALFFEGAQGKLEGLKGGEGRGAADARRRLLEATE